MMRRSPICACVRTRLLKTPLSAAPFVGTDTFSPLRAFHSSKSTTTPTVANSHQFKRKNHLGNVVRVHAARTHAPHISGIDVGIGAIEQRPPPHRSARRRGAVSATSGSADHGGASADLSESTGENTMSERQLRHRDSLRSFLEDANVKAALHEGVPPHRIYGHFRRPHSPDTAPAGRTTVVHPSSAALQRAHVISEEKFVPSSLRGVVTAQVRAALGSAYDISRLLMVRRCYPPHLVSPAEHERKEGGGAGGVGLGEGFGKGGAASKRDGRTSRHSFITGSSGIKGVVRCVAGGANHHCLVSQALSAEHGPALSSRHAAPHLSYALYCADALMAGAAPAIRAPANTRKNSSTSPQHPPDDGESTNCSEDGNGKSGRFAAPPDASINVLEWLRTIPIAKPPHSSEDLAEAEAAAVAERAVEHCLAFEAAASRKQCNTDCAVGGLCLGVLHAPPCLPQALSANGHPLTIIPFEHYCRLVVEPAVAPAFSSISTTSAPVVVVGLLLLTLDECNICVCDAKTLTPQLKTATAEGDGDPITRIVFDVTRPLSPAMADFLEAADAALAARGHRIGLPLSESAAEEHPAMAGGSMVPLAEVHQRRRAFLLTCWAAAGTAPGFEAAPQWCYRIDPRAWETLRPLLELAGLGGEEIGRRDPSALSSLGGATFDCEENVGYSTSHHDDVRESREAEKKEESVAISAVSQKQSLRALLEEALAEEAEVAHSLSTSSSAHCPQRYSDGAHHNKTSAVAAVADDVGYKGSARFDPETIAFPPSLLGRQQQHGAEGSGGRSLHQQPSTTTSPMPWEVADAAPLPHQPRPLEGSYSARIRGKASEQPGYVAPTPEEEALLRYGRGEEASSEASESGRSQRPRFGSRFARQAALCGIAPSHSRSLDTNQTPEGGDADRHLRRHSNGSPFAGVPRPQQQQPLRLLPMCHRKWARLPHTRLLRNSRWITRPRMMAQEMQYGFLELFV